MWENDIFSFRQHKVPTQLLSRYRIKRQIPKYQRTRSFTCVKMWRYHTHIIFSRAYSPEIIPYSRVHAGIIRVPWKKFATGVNLQICHLKKMCSHVLFVQAREYHPRIQQFSNNRVEMMSILEIITLCRRQDTTEGSRVRPQNTTF